MTGKYIPEITIFMFGFLGDVMEKKSREELAILEVLSDSVPGKHLKIWV